MIICADDFGLRQDIDDAILALCARGSLSAVSCMVSLQRCEGASLKRLLKFESEVDIGLHLCLTHEDALIVGAVPNGNERAPSFSKLFRRSICGRIKRSEICRQVAAQYESFVRKTGRRPDHIDGHLHAHQLPAIGQGLLEFVLSLPAEDRPYVRNTSMPLSELRRRKLPWTKAATIGFFGERMRIKLNAAGVATNDGFVGVYDFRNWRLQPGYFPGFVDCLRHPNGILVVHPGLEEDWRRREFETLRDSVFPVGQLNRFRRTESQTKYYGTATSAMPLPEKATDPSVV